jgi:hypothetical protein
VLLGKEIPKPLWVIRQPIFNKQFSLPLPMVILILQGV